CFEGRLSEELRASGAQVYALGAVRARRPLSVRRARRALGELLRRERFDAVVCHAPWAQAVFGAVARETAASRVFWMHAPASGTHWLERWARMETPDLVVCNSRFTAESSGRLYPRARVEVVYCPVRLPDAESKLAKRERSATRAELGTPLDAVVIIQVSRMESWKGHATHLEALGLLRDMPGWFCWQIGGAQRDAEEVYLDGLKRLASQMGIAGRVLFAGQRPDVPRLLTAADIYCQPNTGPEPFGISFVEAMHAGLPVVTASIGGALEIVDESCGALVPPGDAGALSVALRELIRSQSLRNDLGREGVRRAKVLCGPTAQLEKLEEAFTSVARRRAA
ncbi:MAG: glycosyltransferase, partial [Rubrivivax sp.]|nr:glycosyltransferase [Pyrinomonadaceae bacterium]